MKEFEKIYLGDSVYAESDGIYVTLTTENGESSGPSNIIHLEGDVIDSLLFVLRSEKEEEATA